MSGAVKIAPSPVVAPAEAKPGKREDADKVGREFEAILVRQMLSSTHVAGKEGGYADMGVEALATSIGAAGGLGLGRAIADTLAGAAHRPDPAKKNDQPSPQVLPGPAVPLIRE